MRSASLALVCIACLVPGMGVIEAAEGTAPTTVGTFSILGFGSRVAMVGTCNCGG